MKSPIFLSLAASVVLGMLSTSTAISASYRTHAQPCTQITLIDKVNINKANVESLVHVIKGIGKKRAQAIVKYRDEHALFKSIYDLAKVPGLGKHFVERHRKAMVENLTV